MKLFKLCVLMAAAVATQAVTAGDPEVGQQKAAPCAACHGQDGNLIMANYPRLAGQGEKYLVKQLQDFQSGKRANAIMQGQVAGLSEQDMKDIAAFYAAQTPEIGSADPEWLELGERLYRGGDIDRKIPACTGCHGPSGEGIEGAAWPALASQNPVYTEEQLKAFRAAGRNDLGSNIVKRTNDGDNEDEPGMMQEIAARLSDTDIKALSSFISGLHK